MSVSSKQSHFKLALRVRRGKEREKTERLEVINFRQAPVVHLVLHLGRK